MLKTTIAGSLPKPAWLAETETLNPEAVKYLNRLSDHLFVLSRVANREAAGFITSYTDALERPQILQHRAIDMHRVGVVGDFNFAVENADAPANVIRSEIVLGRLNGDVVGQG